MQKYIIVCVYIYILYDLIYKNPRKYGYSVVCIGSWRGYIINSRGIITGSLKEQPIYLRSHQPPMIRSARQLFPGLDLCFLDDGSLCAGT